MLSLSIHPRHWPNFGNGQKKNTAQPQKRKRTRAQENLEARRLDCTNTRESLAKNSRVAPRPWHLAFKMSGSQKK